MKTVYFLLLNHSHLFYFTWTKTIISLYTRDSWYSQFWLSGTLINSKCSVDCLFKPPFLKGSESASNFIRVYFLSNSRTTMSWEIVFHIHIWNSRIQATKLFIVLLFCILLFSRQITILTFATLGALILTFLFLKKNSNTLSWRKKNCMYILIKIILLN